MSPMNEPPILRYNRYNVYTYSTFLTRVISISRNFLLERGHVASRSKKNMPFWNS